MSAKSRRRPGSMAVELLLLVPVILAVIIAAVVLSLLVAAEHKLDLASVAGARVAAQGGNGTDIANAVQASLGGGNWAEADVRARLTDARGLPVPPGGHVEVIVSINAARVVPDALGFIGLSLKQRTLSARTLMRKE